MKPCESLVRRVLDGGGGEALAALFLAVQDDVYRYMASELGRGADAEDAAQETFRRVVEGMRRLREPAAFPGWIFGIARNVAREIRRGHGARRRLSGEIAMTQEPPGEPVDPAEAAERQAQVRRAVEELDEELRTTVRLRYEQGMAYRDIARAMECPEGTVGKRLHTAHERLRERLAGAGLVVAIALLTEDLAVAEPVSAPPALAASLRRMALEQAAVVVPWGGSVAGRGIAFVAAAAILATVAGFAIRAIRHEDGATSTGSVAANGATASGGATPEVAHSRFPGGGGDETRPGRVFLGRVVERSSGIPVPGAEVSFTSGDGNVLNATAATGGDFQVKLPAGSHAVNACAPGFVDLAESRIMEDAGVLHVEGNSPAALTLELIRGADIRGIVTTEQGATLPGAVVECLSQDVTGLDGRLRTVLHGRAAAVADGSGAFTLTGFHPAGTVSLRAHAPGRVPARAIVAPGAEVVFRLEPALVVPGRVLGADGNGIPGARFWSIEPGARVAEALEGPSGADGSFLHQAVPSGSCALAVLAPGHAPGLAPVDASGAAVDVTLAPFSGSLEIQVTDSFGAPVFGARVRLAAASLETRGLGLIAVYGDRGAGPGMLRPGEVVLLAPAATDDAATDARGRTSLPCLASGPGRSVVIRVDAEGLETGWLRTSGEGEARVVMRAR